MNLREAITLATKAAPAKSILPILGSLRIGDGEVTATDMEHQIIIPAELPGELKKPFCINARRMTRVLAALPDENPLTIEVKAKRCFIASGDTRYELQTLPAADFSGITAPKDETASAELTVEGKPLIEALRFVAPAMANGDFRYYLNAMHIATAPGRIIFTATDGHRLHRATVRLTDQNEIAAAHGLLPRVAVARIIEIADGHDDIHLVLTPTRITIEAHATLLAKLIEGAFPDAERVIPAKRPATGNINRKAFSEAVGRVAQIFSNDELKGITLTFAPEHIQMSARNADDEKAAEKFNWAALAGKFKALITGFDEQFLREAMQVFSTERVNLHLPEANDGSLYLTDGDSGDQIAVIMPARF